MDLAQIIKFLEEDEDKDDATMLSAADVEAFAAELVGDNDNCCSTLHQPSQSDGAALYQGNSQTMSQLLLPQCQTLGHDGIVSSRVGQALTGTEQQEQHPSEALMCTDQKEQHLSELESQHHGSDKNQEVDNASSHELDNLALPQQQDGQNAFPVSQSMDLQLSKEKSVYMQEPDQEPHRERESPMDNSENTNKHQSMAETLNNQQPITMNLNDLESFSTVNQHAVGMAMSSQVALTSGRSNQPSMKSNNQQPDTIVKSNKQLPFGLLLRTIMAHLDKDRVMQLRTLSVKFKKKKISKEDFIGYTRSIAGTEMIKMAVYKLQTQVAAANQFQSQPLASARHLQGPSIAQSQSELSSPITNYNTVKSRNMESQADSHGVPISQMAISSSSGLTRESKYPAIPTEGLNKQQCMPLSQASFPTYGIGGSSYSPFSATNVSSSTSFEPQHHDSQMRQAAAHPNMSIHHLGPTTQAMKKLKMSQFDRPHAFSDPTKMQTGILTQFNRLQQNQAQWSSSNCKEQKSGGSSSITHVNQEPADQSNEQHKSQLSSSQGLNSMSSAPYRQGNAAPGNLKDGSFEMLSSKTGFLPSRSLAMPVKFWDVFSNAPLRPGKKSKRPPKKPRVGQKKPMEAPGSLPTSCKKQKETGGFLDQSIEELNDVTAVSGVDLREEEDQLFSGLKEDSRISEASRQLVQEEEERLIFHKTPLQKKLVEIMGKCGVKSKSNDVLQCLSVCVEERMRGLIANLIRLSKQRVDTERPRHRTVVTSNVRQQIMTINHQASEEREERQAETEKSQKQNKPEICNGIDGEKEKDEGRAKSAKANNKDHYKMRAANVVVRAATGVSDMLPRWQLMVEARHKQGGNATTSSGSQPGEDFIREALQTSTRYRKENQEVEKWDSSAGFCSPASVRNIGRNQVVVSRPSRSISVKDVIAILEREPRMSKSMLLCRLYNKVRTCAAA